MFPFDDVIMGKCQKNRAGAGNDEICKCLLKDVFCVLKDLFLGWQSSFAFQVAGKNYNDLLTLADQVVTFNKQEWTLTADGSPLHNWGHNSNVWWTSGHVKSPENRLFVHQSAQTNTKETLNSALFAAVES